ncbi:MAG: MBL fold metallo-hydrolase, partial [Clostridia bacterium]|nr:MBL fold metallo-hydrolase [Clostridia bacterium]
TIDLDPSVKISVLNPPGTLPADLNNQSIVLRLTYGTISLLLTGDAERPVEQGLSNAQAQILKAGHHGSSTSTTPEFLKAVNPEIAIISCGKDNSYGHPHQEVLDRLMKANIKIYRTDVSGDIIVKTNGQSYSVSTTPWTDQGTMIIPSPVDQGAYVGSIKSDKYHYPNCRHAESIQPVNKIWFKTKAEAEAKGYVPCKVCKP